MTPEEIEKAKSGLGEELFTGWGTGYRSWKLKFPKEVQGPRLGSVTGFGRGWWEPEERGIVRSDWEPGEDVSFQNTSKGLYSLKSLKEVKERYPGEDIYGAIIPFGEVAEGSRGWRAEKAKVRSLFRGVPRCTICSKPARYFLHNDEKWTLCEKDFKRIERLAQKKGFTMEDVEEVLHKLADIYEAEIAEAPED